jgi:hypothetical protein
MHNEFCQRKVDALAREWGYEFKTCIPLCVEEDEHYYSPVRGRTRAAIERYLRENHIRAATEDYLARMADVFINRPGDTIYVYFRQKNDAMMFKLTWEQ